MKTSRVSLSRNILFFVLFPVLLLSGFFLYKAWKKPAINTADLDFKPYITAYTGGTVSAESPIVVRFAAEVPGYDKVNTSSAAEWFDFDPAISGTSSWIDKHTLLFKPAQKLDPDTRYQARLSIGKILPVPEKLKEFEFSFATMPQVVDVSIEGLRYYDTQNLGYAKLLGVLNTSDPAENAAIEKVFVAGQNNRKLSMKWIHSGDNRIHQFVIDSIVRTNIKGQVQLSWDGKAISSSSKGSTVYPVEPLSQFSIIDVQSSATDDQHVAIQFTDPLQPDQDLIGYIAMQNIPDLRMVIEENVVKVYPPVRQEGVKTITVIAGIKNSLGKILRDQVIREVTFEDFKPAVRLSGKGVIVPSTAGLTFPFEAVGLKSVQVKVIKIYSANVIQFFQSNTFDGMNELRRVGKMVVNKKISLNSTSPSEFKSWKKYSIDVAKLLTQEPGALYQIKISFSKKDAYSLCTGTLMPEYNGLVEDIPDQDEPEYNDWEYYDDYYARNFIYGEREDPCTDSYYGDYRSVKRNVLASDVGVIAKYGTSGSMYFITSDLNTALPLAGAKVELYDYQQQLLQTASSDGDGVVKVVPKGKPFFVIVTKDKQIGYLKIDNNSALPVANFNVAGAKVQKGLKGFLYGDRGVWRPGDSLYLTFILQDKSHTLPAQIPVAFELVNPMGQITKSMVLTSQTDGFYNFKTATSFEDRTGNWLAKVKVGGASFQYPIKIETIIPNRLKIALDFGDRILAEKGPVYGKLDVRWLHGAVARNLNTDINLKLLEGSTKFANYPTFIFDDPAGTFETEEVEIYRGKLDQNGHAEIHPQINTKGNAPGVLTASFRVKVREDGGAFSTDRFSLPYYPYDHYTGIKLPIGDKTTHMLLTNTNHPVKLVSVDASGRPAAGRKLELKVYQLKWRWWWDQSEDNLPAFMDNTSVKALQTDTVVTDMNGTANWSFRINSPAWGRFLVRAYDLESKHATGQTAYIDWPAWAGKTRENDQEVESMLSFTLDKEKYNVGETVNVSIPGTSTGRALVSLETGTQVLQTLWVDTKTGNNTFRFKVTQEMAPGVYVHVTLLKAHKESKNNLPIRMYGIMPLVVENKETILQPVISMPNEIRPESNFSVTVSEKTGKPMTFTLAIVDEGLLDLTRYKTPDPWTNFYTREALGVNTWDMYQYVVGASADKMDRILSIGGDAELKGTEKNRANRFKPVVLYKGPQTLEANKSTTFSFTMPQYVGSVRVMVVAGNNHNAYGSAEKTANVKKPLMLLATIPRVIGPDETFAVPVNVFALTAGVKNVTVQIKANNKLIATGTSQKEMVFSTPGDQVINFYYKVKPETGIGKINILATAGAERAVQDIEIEIRNPNPKLTTVTESILEPNKVWNTIYKPIGMAGTNRATIEVSAIPAMNLEERLNYLIQYPYGCAEQTISSVFPQLYVLNYVQSPFLKASVETNIKSGIDRLRLLQQADGGIAYWPGTEDISYWNTTYAGHFLIEAEKGGYAIPHGMMQQWKAFEKKAASRWSGNYQSATLDQAYRLYTLALAGEGNVGAMNRLKESKSLSVAALWRLAGAYHLTGRTEAAKALIRGASNVVKPYRELDNTFGSDLRDKAIILETMCLLGMKPEAFGLVQEISAALAGKGWMSTQEVAACLLAMSKYALIETTAVKVHFSYSANRDKTITAVTDMKLAQVNLPAPGQPTEVVLKNLNTRGILYARVVQSGIPASGTEQAMASNLNLAVSYKSKNGSPIDFARLVQGDDFYAEVTVFNPGNRGDYKNLSLQQIFPSGWEIMNERLADPLQAGGSPATSADGKGDEEAVASVNERFENPSTANHRDVRDDRIYTFFDLKAGEKKVFRATLNAAYLGRFYLPAIKAGAMYDGSIQAVVRGQWVDVIPQAVSGL